MTTKITLKEMSVSFEGATPGEVKEALSSAIPLLAEVFETAFGALGGQTVRLGRSVESTEPLTVTKPPVATTPVVKPPVPEKRGPGRPRTRVLSELDSLGKRKRADYERLKDVEGLDPTDRYWKRVRKLRAVSNTDGMTARRRVTAIRHLLHAYDNRNMAAT